MTTSASTLALSNPSRGRSLATWFAQLVAAVILGQTLFFKFSAAPPWAECSPWR